MPAFGPLVDAGWLARASSPGDTAGHGLGHGARVAVVDVRWYLDGRSGLEAYRRGHIPGAVFVDLDGALAGRPGPHGRHPLPEPEVFGAAMRAAGVDDDTNVVAYDDAAGAVAARLWWMLRATGHDAAVLDGGIQAWSGSLVTGDEAAPPPGSFTPTPWPADAVVDANAIASRPRQFLLLDARAPERYRGETEPVDPRPGHIPGAHNAPFGENVDPSSGRFLSPSQLRARYTALGVDETAGRDDRAGPTVVAYCGSGVTACHDLLALEVAGLRGRLYPGSWSEWCADPDRPAELGDPYHG